MTRADNLEKPSNAGRRRTLLALTAGGAGLAMALALRRAIAQSVQGLRSVQGDVRVNGEPASAGTLVRPGDTVSTARGALATFVVGQDAYLMREDSRLELAGVAQFVDLLRLTTGRLLGVFGKGGDRRIITPSAAIGIRGTGAYIESEQNRSYFCLCYGSAEIASTDGAARDAYSTRHHDSPRYIYGDGRANAIVPASVSNHTDEELIMLEALTGRLPPQSVMDGPRMSDPYR